MSPQERVFTRTASSGHAMARPQCPRQTQRDIVAGRGTEVQFHAVDPRLGVFDLARREVIHDGSAVAPPVTTALSVRLYDLESRYASLQASSAFRPIIARAGACHKQRGCSVISAQAGIPEGEAACRSGFHLGRGLFEHKVKRARSAAELGKAAECQRGHLWVHRRYFSQHEGGQNERCDRPYYGRCK